MSWNTNLAFFSQLGLVPCTEPHTWLSSCIACRTPLLPLERPGLVGPHPPCQKPWKCAPPHLLLTAESRAGGGVSARGVQARHRAVTTAQVKLEISVPSGEHGLEGVAWVGVAVKAAWGSHGVERQVFPGFRQ